MIKTAIENGQNLIVEGCYIPFDWKNDFDTEYLQEIRYICLVMASDYIQNHWPDICFHANDIEYRLDDSGLTPENLESENQKYLYGCIDNGLNYILIKNGYYASFEERIAFSIL